MNKPTTYYNIHDKLLVSSNLGRHDFLKYFASSKLAKNNDVEIDYVLSSFSEMERLLHTNQNDTIKIGHGLYYIGNKDMVISFVNILGLHFSWSIAGLFKRMKVVMSNTQVALTRPPLDRLFPMIPSVDLYTAMTLHIKLLQKGSMFILASCLRSKATGDAILISSHPGMGKTELTLKLVKSGSYEYMSDDLTIIDQSGCAYSFPRPIVRRSRIIPVLESSVDPVKLSLFKLHNSQRKAKTKSVYIVEYGEKERAEQLDIETALRKLLVINRSTLPYCYESAILGYEYINKEFATDDLRKCEQTILRSFLDKVSRCTLLRVRQEKSIIDALLQVEGTN